MKHAEPHGMAGQTVKIAEGVSDPAQGAVVAGALYRIEDWWDRITGGSWMSADGNPAAMHYAMRSASTAPGSVPVPIDDEVLYGKIGSLGHLVHVSEIEWPS